MSPLFGRAQELLWIATTLAIFFAWRQAYLRVRHALLHPVLWSTLLLVLLVVISRTPPVSFSSDTKPLVWLLGPAIVAMALPVFQQRALIFQNWRIFAAVVGASLMLTVVTLLLLPAAIGFDMARALSVKSVTAAVALDIAKQAGLRPDLAVTAVMASGLFGIALGPALLAIGGIKGNRPEVGAALGCAAHGLGTARAYEIGQTAGAFASVSMGLSALVYGFFLPLLLRSI